MKNSTLFDRVTNNWPAKILSVVAAILLFLFYRISALEQRYVSVPLKEVTNGLFVPSNDLPREVSVSLRGKADTVFLVRDEDIEAYVDLSGFRSEGIYRVPVKIRKRGTSADADVEVRVNPIDLTVSMERLVTKQVEVTPSVKGFAAKGYELGQYFVTPEEVEIEGPRSKVEAIGTVTTADVSIEGRDSDFTTPVDVALGDSNVSVVGNQMVDFHGVIQEITMIKTLDPVDVVALDLAPDLRLNSSMTSGSVNLQGTELAVEQVKPGDVTLDVDCSKIKAPGVYSLPTKASVPKGMVALSYSPETVTLTISAGDQEPVQ